MQGSGVSAELQCDRDLLVDMASEILAVRGELKGFSGSSVGGDAAYFLMRYGIMDAAKALDALQTGRPYRQADDLVIAHRITALGPTGVALWGGEPTDILIAAHWPVQRAILLLDNGDTYFNIVREIGADAKLAEQFASIWLNGVSLHAVLTDQPPDVLQQIAERAESDGHFAVAASLYAMMPEGNYEQFWERVKDSDSDSELVELASPLKMNLNGTIALKRHIALPSPDQSEEIELRLERQRLLLGLKAGMSETGTQTILISINQTGRVQDMATVSERFLAAIETEEIHPQRRPEEGWAFLLSSMSDVLGAEDVERVLTSFDQQADRRHYSGRSLDVLQMATAAEAAGKWLREEVAEAPERPASLASSFDWPQALAVWSLVKAGGHLPQEALTGRVLSLALEGHVQRGEFVAALDLAERAGGINKRLIMARDIMLRQNRLCDQHGILPGAAVLLGGQLLYDFQ